MTGLYIARITIEAISPMSVGSGEAGVSDVLLVRDANGLPMIAGASLQGLMKALAGRDSITCRDDLLGSKGKEGKPGRIRFSDARIHGGNDEAVSGVRLAGVQDELLKRYLVDEPLKRDHVKIDYRGAGDDLHKFDRTALPRGTRFSFELTMWGSEADKADFLSILSLVHHPLFRPGGATRRGYGRVEVHAGGWEYWADPRSSVKVIDGLRRLPFSRVDDLPKEIPVYSGSGLTTYTLKLASDSWWRAGGDGERVRTGQYLHNNADNRKDETDLAFKREPSICWDAGSNRKGWQEPGDAIAEDYVLTGSSIRGALAHRALFHWNRLNGGLFNADAPDEAAFTKASATPAELLALFGAVKTDTSGQRSALILEDLVFLPQAVTAADHVKIDRFTGGATTGALFSEELVWTGVQELELAMIVDTKLLEERLPSNHEGVLTAFKAAVDDLCKGRLALGAKSSGFFKGTCTEEAAW